MMKKYLPTAKFKVLAVVAAAAIMVSCSDNNNTQKKTENQTPAVTAAVTQKDNLPTYLVAVEATYAPYAFRDEKGAVVGFDEDILYAIARAEHFRVKILPREWKGIFDTLTHGTRDIVASGVQLTPERQEKYGVTDPIDTSSDIAMVRGDSNIVKPEDLSGKTVAVQKGTALEGMLKSYPGIHFIEYPTSYFAYKAMVSGKTDAVFNDAGVLRYFRTQISENHKIREIKFPNMENTVSVFCTRKDNTKLLNLLNDGLKKIKANGEYEKIRQKWFGYEG